MGLAAVDVVWWLVLARDDGDLALRLAGVLEVARGIDRVDGAPPEGLLAAAVRLHHLVAGVSADELAELRRRVAALLRELEDAVRRLAELRRLKDRLG